MFRVVQKLRKLKAELRMLNRKNFNDVLIQADIAHDLLLAAQKRLNDDPLNLSLQDGERIAAKQYSDLHSAAESFLRQKARVDWIALGDSNSAYFFHFLFRRRAQVIVTGIQDSNGQWLHKMSMLVEFYTDSSGDLLLSFYGWPEREQRSKS